MYYIIVDDDARQYIDPGQIDGGGVKYGSLMYGESSRLIAYMIMDSGWSKIRIVGDYSDEYVDLQAKYRNVSLEAVAGYNDGADRKIGWNPDALTLSAYDRLEVDAAREPDRGREIALRRLTRLFLNDPEEINKNLVHTGSGVWALNPDHPPLIPREETVDALVIGYATGWAEAMEKKGGL